MNLATDAATFRKILGHYPTGVCAITAMSDTGIPSAMVVGSFTSVSLDPPLVAFLPDKSSTSWPKIEASGRFCVNVLGDNQEALRSEEHTSELQSLMRISYAVFCLKKKKINKTIRNKLIVYNEHIIKTILYDNNR